MILCSITCTRSNCTWWPEHGFLSQESNRAWM